MLILGARGEEKGRGEEREERAEEGRERKGRESRIQCSWGIAEELDLTFKVMSSNPSYAT